VPARGHDDAQGSVHERRLRELSPPPAGHGLLCHGLRTVDLGRGAGRQRDAVGPAHDTRVEKRKQPGDVAAVGGSEEGIDDVPVPGELAL